MFILIPIEDTDSSMNVSKGDAVSIIPLDFLSIHKITEDADTGNAYIEYKASPPIKTLIPFTKLMNVLVAQGLLYFDFAEECSKLSPNVRKYITQRG